MVPEMMPEPLSMLEPRQTYAGRFIRQRIAGDIVGGNIERGVVAFAIGTGALISYTVTNGSTSQLNV